MKVLTTFRQCDIQKIFFIIAGVVLFRYVRLMGGSLIYDDSFITFRYATNMAEGMGLVYNIGDKVLGTTTPLWAILLSLFHFVGLDIVTFSQILGILFDAATCCLLFSMITTNKSDAGLWAAIIWMVYPYSISAAISGMETSLFVFLNIHTLFLISKRNYNPWLRLSAPLATLTRPEGVIILIISLYDLYVNDAKRVRSLALSMIIPLAWASFATLYFGSPIPHSIMAKRINIENSSTLAEIFAGIFQGETATLLPFLPIGIYYVVKRRKLMHPLMWTSIYTGLYAITTPKMWVWYYLPMQMGMILISAVGIAHVIEWVSMTSNKSLIFNKKSLTSVGIVILFILAFYYHLPARFGVINRERARYESLAEYVADKTDKTASILASDIGYLGFYSNRTILDAWGLVWPQALEFPGTNAERIPLIAREYYPAAVVIPYTRDFFKETIAKGWFRTNYYIDTAFTFKYVDVEEINIDQVPEMWSSQYLVYYQRKKTDSREENKRN